MRKLGIAAGLLSLVLVSLYYVTTPKLVEIGPSKTRISYFAFEQVDDVKVCKNLAEDLKSVLRTTIEYDCEGRSLRTFSGENLAFVYWFDGCRANRDRLFEYEEYVEPLGETYQAQLSAMRFAACDW